MPDYIVTPGEIMVDYLECADLSQDELSKDTGIPLETINDIINGKGTITDDIAERLEKNFCNTKNFWLALQKNFDVYMEELRKTREEK